MLLGLVLRLGLAFGAEPASIDGDPRFYDRAGVAVSEGRGWPRVAGAGHATALHPPAWPYLLGATYAVTGIDDREDRWRAARVLNAFLGAASVALIGLLGAALFTSRVGLVAAGLYAVYPAPAILGTTLLSETLFVTLMLAAILATLRACREVVDISTTSRHSPRLRWVLVAGVLVGLAALTRPNGIILLLPLGLLLHSWRRAAVLAAVAALTILPWTIRNYIVVEAVVPVATNTGKTLAGTYNATARGHKYRWAKPKPPDLPNEADRSSEQTRQALDYVQANPLAVPKAFVWNTARLAELDPVGRSILASALRSDRLASVYTLSFIAMALLAAAGLLLRPSMPWRIWLIPLLFYLSAALVAVNFSRFRAPLEPFLALSAAVLVCHLVDRRRPAAP